MLTRDAILAQMARRTKVIASDVLGGDLRIQELLRSEYRATERAAADAKSVDVWNAGIFATAVIDTDSKPLFSADEVLLWPERSALWGEVLRIAQAALDLSEVGSEALKELSTVSPETTTTTPSTDQA